MRQVYPLRSQMRYCARTLLSNFPASIRYQTFLALEGFLAYTNISFKFTAKKTVQAYCRKESLRWATERFCCSQSCVSEGRTSCPHVVIRQDQLLSFVRAVAKASIVTGRKNSDYTAIVNYWSPISPGYLVQFPLPPELIVSGLAS